MECRILGPLEVTTTAGPLEIRGARRRALVAFLLVNSGSAVTIDDIVDAVWADDGDLNSRQHTIQNYVSQLRKLFADDDATIATVSGGYRLEIPRAALDANRFEDLRHAAAAATDAVRRRDLLAQALDCWHGRALGEFEDCIWAQSAATALENRRLEVLEQRIDVDLALGRAADLVSELETLVRHYPLRERFWAQRMLALYRSGRQAEALRTCTELRTLLADELGIEPSAEIAELELRILDQDPALFAATAGASAAAAAATSPLPEGTVTFVMTDIVASTELWDEHAAAMAAAVRTHETVIESAVSAHSGQMLKRHGEGDSTVSVFVRAVDALAAALAIRAGMRGANLVGGELPLALRIAMHTGEAELRDGDYFGPALNRTARIRALATGDEILCSRTTAEVVADALAPTVALVELGPMRLRGMRRVEVVYRVWDRSEPAPAVGADAPGTFDLEADEYARVDPERLVSRLGAAVASGPALVGREPEWALLMQSWQRARRAARQIVFISGEPGIGKTRLAAEAARVALGDGATVLYGRCDEGLGVPYQPFVETLRAYVEACPDLELAGALGRYPGDLCRLLPELTERLADVAPPMQSDPATEQYRLFDAVASWLSASSLRNPAIVVLDDLHWAAEPTLLLLRHVASSERRARLLILATYRPSDLAPAHPLVRLLADVRTASEPESLLHLELAGLDEAAVATCVRQVSREAFDPPPPSFVHALHAHTGGNPFFVNEVLRSLAEADALDLHDPAVRIPPAVREVVMRRVARLSDPAQHALTVAAVIGDEFEVSVLDAAVDRDESDELLDALEEASRARLVAESGPERFSFAHALVRAALYNALTESRQARLHRRVGAAIEQVYADRLDAHLSELAYHYATAAPQQAIQYAIAAADAALRSLAFEDAITICERAFGAVTRAHEANLVVAVTDECDLLVRLGRAQFRAGRPAARRTLLRAYELARAANDSRRMADAVLATNRGFFAQMGRVDRELVEALESTTLCQPAGDSSVLAELLAATASELEWAVDGDRRFALSDRALAIARRVDDPRTLARVLLLRLFAITAPDTLDERLANCDELLQLAEALGDPAISFQAAWSRASTVAESGDFEAAGAMVELASRMAVELRQPTLLWQASSMGTSRLILQGDLDGAQRLADDTLELGRHANREGEALLFYNEQILEICRWQDRLGEVMGPLREFAGSDSADFGYALTRYLYDAHDDAQASACYAKIMRELRLPPRRDLLAAATLCNLAYLASRFNDRDRARLLYEQLAPYAHAFANTTVTKPVGAHFLGMLATTMDDIDIAEAHFEAALAAHEQAGAPLLAAETQLEWARATMRRPDPTRAATLLNAARTAARAHNASFLAWGCEQVAGYIA